MIKWMKYTGLYFIITSVGYTMLKFMNVHDVWLWVFTIGNVFYYFCQVVGKGFLTFYLIHDIMYLTYRRLI